MKSGQIENLFNHMIWADAEVWKKVLSFPQTENDERIKKLLYHLHQVQYAYLYLYDEHPPKIPKPEEFTNLESIALWGREYQEKLNLFLSTEKEGEKIIEIPWAKFWERKIGKKVVAATLEETMMQVSSHSTYHRGQINTRLRELGGEPAIVDFIVWVWLGKPLANRADVLN